jgi:site-specific recombinase XerD
MVALAVSNTNDMIGGNITMEDYRSKLNGLDIIERFLKEFKSESTKKSYRKSINDFYTWLYGDKTLTLQMMIIDPVHAGEYSAYWMEQLNNGKIKTSTYNCKFKGIKSFYDWLITRTTSNTLDFTMMKINPFNVVKQMKEYDSEGSDALEPDEIMLMLSNPYGRGKHIQERNVLMFVLAITTGIRNHALLTITENNIIKMGNDWVIDTIDKEDKQALKPINNYYDRLMNWYHEDKKTRTDKDNTIFNIHPIHANKVISDWAKSVGIDKKITFHSLRATTAVRIYEDNDGNLAKVQLALNHSHMETSKIYVDKNNKINHDAENIIESLQNVTTFEEKMEQLSKEELLEILSSLNASTKMQILKNL